MTIERARWLRAAAALAVAALAAAAGCGGGAPATCAGGGPCGGGGGGGGGGDGGGGDGGARPTGACGTVQPCGGELAGDWTFVDECESAASLATRAATFRRMAADSWCVGQTLVGVAPQASGSLAFDAAGGTYALALVFGGYIDIDYPASCLAGLGCDEVTVGLQSEIDGGTFLLEDAVSISCAGSSSCVCRAVLHGPRSEAGTYASAGNVVTFTASTGDVNGKSYCVEGGRLHILQTSIGSTGRAVVDTDLVAMRP